MPKRVGYLYDKMVDREFIRAVILDASKGRRNRKDIARVMADLDGYVERTYELVATESFVPSVPKVRRSTMRAARSTGRSKWSRSGRTASFNGCWSRP